MIPGERRIELADGTSRAVRSCSSCFREIYFSELAMGHMLPYNISNHRQHVCYEGLEKFGKKIWHSRVAHECQFYHQLIKIGSFYWLRPMAGFTKEYYHKDCVQAQLDAEMIQ